MRMTGMAMHVIRTDGFLALYNGLSASVCRQVSAGSPCSAEELPCAGTRPLISPPSR